MDVLLIFPLVACVVTGLAVAICRHRRRQRMLRRERHLNEVLSAVRMGMRHPLSAERHLKFCESVTPVAIEVRY
jgi:hypothetical protein